VSIRARFIILLLAASASVCAANPLSPAELAQSAGFDQHLNTQLPSDLQFRDETGHELRLGNYFGTTPTVLVFSYYGCSTLCPTVISNLAARLDGAGLIADKQYQVLAVSIDPRDSPSLATAKKAIYLEHALPAQTAAWHLLTGDESSISALTRAAGFRYAWDEASQQYAHHAGIVLVTPDGVVSHYFFGFDFTPAELRDALADAGTGHITSSVERLLLLCFHFDPATGKYSLAIVWTLRWMALAMGLSFAAWLAVNRLRH
jgi:protein SCO1/2